MGVYIYIYRSVIKCVTCVSLFVDRYNLSYIDGIWKCLRLDATIENMGKKWGSHSGRKF